MELEERPSPECREIFAYRDGPHVVHTDPITIYHVLSNLTQGRHAAMNKARKSRDLDTAYDATEAMLYAVRSAFRLQYSTDADAMATLDAWLAWLGYEEQRGQELSDMVSTYGVDVINAPYRVYVQLWLNLDRVTHRRAFAVAEGVTAALGDGKLPRDFFAAQCATAAEGANLEYEANSERAERRAMAKRAK